MSSMSMPFRMPVSASARARMTPSKPTPYSGRWISSRVGRAHGGDRVAEVHAGLQQADVIPELQPVDGEQIPAQAEARQPRLVDDALIRQVVDREHRRHRAERRVAREVLAQIRRRQPGLPVVGVHDVDRRRLPRRPLERGDDQEGEAQRVVGEVDAAAVVEPGTMVERRALDQHRARARRRVAPRRARPRTDVPATAAETSCAPLPGRHAAVAWREERHLVAEPAECARQRAGHVGQAAGLRERRRFRGDHQHPQRRRRTPRGARFRHGGGSGSSGRPGARRMRAGVADRGMALPYRTSTAATRDAGLV